MTARRVAAVSAGLVALASAAVLYALYDPAESALCPKCLFHLLTGLECPGCGSQRAVHCLLNGDVAGAVRCNALLVALIPYLAVWLVTALLSRVSESGRLPLLCRRVQNVLYRGRAVRVLLAAVLVFWVARNFTPAF